MKTARDTDSEADGATIRILHIDDDEENYLVVRGLLSRLKAGKYVVDWSPSYEDGLLRAGSGEYQVCLVDYRLGERSGVELVREARESGLTVPMILLTGQGNEDVDLEAMQAGATNYLVNGETPPALLERTIRYSVALNAGRRRADKTLGASSEMRAVVADPRTEHGVRNTLDNLRAFVGLFTPLGIVLEADRLPLEGAGLRREDVIGKEFAETYWWNYAPEVQAQVRDSFRRAARGEIVSGDFRPRMANDVIIDTLAVFTPVRDSSGTVVEVVMSAFDITERRHADAAMRESEERFAAAFEHAPIGVALVSPDGRWLKVNRAICELLGYSEAELLGNTFQDLTLREDIDLSLDNVRRAIGGESRSFQIEKRYINKSGHIVTALLSSSLVRDAQGQPRYFISQIQDITERKRAEKALQESEERYRAVVEWSTESISVQREGKVLFANPATLKMMGATSQEEIVGKSLLDFVHRDFHQVVLERVKSNVKRGSAVPMTDLRLVKLDGAVIDVESQGTSIVYDGEPAVLSSIRDVTERRQTELALRASEARFQNAFTHAPTSIALVSPSGRFLQVNKSFCSMVGYTADELLATDFQSITQPDDRAASRDILKRLMAGEMTTVRIEKRYLNKLGHEVFAITHLSLVQDEQNEPAYVIAQAQDVTAQKRADDERKAIAEIVHAVLTTSSLDEFFTIAHRAIIKLLPAKNCYIALYDKTSDLLSMPFCRDDFDEVAPPKRLGRGLTAFVLRTGRPMLLNPKLIHELVLQGEIELVGTLPAAWLGVPLRTSNEIIGVLVVQHYEDKNAYCDRDIELLAAVGDQIGLAIERKQIELKLKTNEIQLTAAQEIAHIGSFEYDVVKKELHWSEEFFRIFGLPPQGSDPSEREFFSRVHPDDMERYHTGSTTGHHTRIRLSHPAHGPGRKVPACRRGSRRR